MQKPYDIQTVGLVAHSHLDRAGVIILKRVVAFLEKKKLTWHCNDHAATFLKAKSMALTEMMEKLDLVITFGGDGTLIKLAHHTGYKDVPVLAVHLGNLGILTEIENPKLIFSALRKILEGKYHLDGRIMLRVTIYRQGKKAKTFLALNEAVINQGNFARLIQLRAEINQRSMVRFKADGVIISTPTGSTGHSLSAGGPIVHPKLDAIVFTPICPATLSMRPIVIPSSRQLTLILETERRYAENDVALTIDGQIVTQLKYGDEIKVRRSARTFILARMTNKRYYKVLHEKLHWGG